MAAKGQYGSVSSHYIVLTCSCFEWLLLVFLVVKIIIQLCTNWLPELVILELSSCRKFKQGTHAWLLDSDCFSRGSHLTRKNECCPVSSINIPVTLGNTQRSTPEEKTLLNWRKTYTNLAPAIWRKCIPCPFLYLAEWLAGVKLLPINSETDQNVYIPVFACTTSP